MKTAAEFRADAAKCRALAEYARDAMTADNLRALAQDYEAHARALENGPEADPPLPRPE